MNNKTKNIGQYKGPPYPLTLLEAHSVVEFHQLNMRPKCIGYTDCFLFKQMTVNSTMTTEEMDGSWSTKTRTKMTHCARRDINVLPHYVFNKRCILVLYTLTIIVLVSLSQVRRRFVRSQGCLTWLLSSVVFQINRLLVFSFKFVLQLSFWGLQCLALWYGFCSMSYGDV